MTTAGIIESPQESAFETVQRWETSGGHWQVLSRGPSGLVVALLRCDGGEEAHRFISPDPALAAYIGNRDTDADEATTPTVL